jgi:RNA polymerase sigma-70 factor (ECF subfamily)
MVTPESCSEKTDEELVLLSAASSEWFYCLAKRYEEKLLRYIRRISGMSQDEAEDVFQEVLINTYAHLNAFDPRLKFSSWVYRITHNQTISAVRKRSVRPTILIDERDIETWADETDLIGELDAKRDRALINAAFEQLDEKYREVLLLRFVDQLEYLEIADVLQKPLSTVGNLIARGRKQFRTVYEQLTTPSL